MRAGYKKIRDWYVKNHREPQTGLEFAEMSMAIDLIQKWSDENIAANEYFNDGVEEAARKAESWGDECAGGSGGEIIQTGPSKGQRYGEGYYNLANSIRKLKRG